MADRAGQQIGNYRLTRLLGSGGFAEVWLGEHLHLQEYAALKTFTALYPQAQQMFLKEAKIIKKFSHPHIIKLFDYTIENNIPVIIMGYASNGILESRHPRGQIVPLATIIEYLKPIASAIDYAPEKSFESTIKASESSLATGEVGSLQILTQGLLVYPLSVYCPQGMSLERTLLSDEKDVFEVHRKALILT